MLLDLDILVLGKVFHWSEPDILAMASSRRRRMVRLNEEVTRQENAKARGQTTNPQPTLPTGIAPKHASGEAISLDYGV